MREWILSVFFGVTACALSHASHAENTNTNLTFYVVQAEQTNGGRLFDEFPFPKLGYVSLEPDLIITQLKEVNLEEKPARSALFLERESGKTRKGTIYQAPRLFFTLLDEDAARVKALADRAPGESCVSCCTQLSRHNATEENRG